MITSWLETISISYILNINHLTIWSCVWVWTLSILSSIGVLTTFLCLDTIFSFITVTVATISGVWLIIIRENTDLLARWLLSRITTSSWSRWETTRWMSSKWRLSTKSTSTMSSRWATESTSTMSSSWTTESTSTVASWCSKATWTMRSLSWITSSWSSESTSTMTTGWTTETSWWSTESWCG